MMSKRLMIVVGTAAVGLALVAGTPAAQHAALDFDAFAPVAIAHLPTPLERVPNLSASLGGPTILIKRDDQTGLAFGGNKARKLDFILADAKRKNADVVITSAGVQSNWARSTAAGARKLGMRPVLVLSTGGSQPAAGGNLWLDRILDADVRLVEPGQDQQQVFDEIVADEKAKGHRPYVVTVGGSRTGGSMTEPLGAVAYAKTYQEIHDQAASMNVRVTHVVLSTGSGSTQAGLVVGAKALDPDVEVIGIRHSPGGKEAAQTNVATIATQTAEVMGLDLAFGPDDIIVYDEYGGEGYGVMTPEVAGVIATVARAEGLLLDPVYTAKAMIGLMDLVEQGYFEADDVVVFLHSGGTPNLFIYEQEMQELLKDPSN